MRFLLHAFLALFLLCGETGSLASANPMVHREGLQLLDGRNRPLQLRGVNLAGWYQWEGFLWGKGILASYGKVLKGMDKLLGPEGARRFQQEVYDSFITENDIAKISSLGFNNVRILINRRLLVDEADPDRFLNSGWAQLDRALGWCEKYRVYAVLDLHAVPGGQSMLPTSDAEGRGELIWNSPANQQRTVELWRAIAHRYATREIVAGYDLINEPGGPGGEALTGIYTRIISAIRSVDKDHMLILEGGKLASDFSMFSHPLDPNQIYSFHMYTWFGDNRAKLLAEYAAVARQQNVPFWVGEFGENTYEMIRSTVQLYGSSGYIAGWCYFPWKRAPTKYPGLVTFDVPEDWGKVIASVTSPFFIPRREVVIRQGIREFFGAIALQNGHLDQQMVDILVHHSQQSREFAP